MGMTFASVFLVVVLACPQEKQIPREAADPGWREKLTLGLLWEWASGMGRNTLFVPGCQALPQDDVLFSSREKPFRSGHASGPAEIGEETAGCSSPGDASLWENARRWHKTEENSWHSYCSLEHSLSPLFPLSTLIRAAAHYLVHVPTTFAYVLALSGNSDPWQVTSTWVGCGIAIVLSCQEREKDPEN